MFLVNSVSHLLYGDFKGGVYPPFAPYPPFPVPFAPSLLPLPSQTLFPRSFLKRWFFTLFIEPFNGFIKKLKIRLLSKFLPFDPLKVIYFDIPSKGSNPHPALPLLPSPHSSSSAPLPPSGLRTTPDPSPLPYVWCVY